MLYYVQLLDASKNVLAEEQAESWSAMNVFELTPKDWPPHAVTLRVLDPDGYSILILSKDENKRLAAPSATTIGAVASGSAEGVGPNA